MKINSNKKIILAAGLMLCLAIFASSDAQAASFNYGTQDSPTLQISNYSRNPGCTTCWSGSASADAGEIVSFMVYYHNTASDTAANTVLRVNLPSGTFNSTTVSGGVEADSSSGASGSVSLYLSSNQSLSFIPGSLKWYPNQSSGSQGAPFGQSGSEIISSGLRIGSITGGWSSQGYAVFQAQVSSNSAPATPDPTPSYNYSQNYYTPSYVPVYIPSYQPTQTYTTPTPAPSFQTNPVTIPVSRPRTTPVLRGEDSLEFEIFLDKERSLPGDENVLFARYYNSGESAARNATLYITLPDGVEFLKFTATPALMRDKNHFEYTIGEISPGEEKVVSLNFLVSTGMIPGNSLLFEGKLVLTGSRGTLKSFQDSAVLEVTTANQLTASAYTILGPLLNSWMRQLLLGVIIGFVIHYYFFNRKKEELKFK